MDWFVSRGALVGVPIAHSPNWDFLAELDARLIRVQVKTSTVFHHRAWVVTVCTRGGNRSWNGLVKRFDPNTSDILFAVVGDGRRWCIPSDVLVGRTSIALGGPRYADYEVERGRPLPRRTGSDTPSTIAS
jgi:hypothetical protein